MWRGESSSRESLFALKVWPLGYDFERLGRIHRWMTVARNRGPLSFVPAIVPTISGETALLEAGRLWDLIAWMPGLADFDTSPIDARLVATMTALAQLHRAWLPPIPTFGPCPAVLRRLDVLNRVPPTPTVSDPRLRECVRRACERFPTQIPQAIAGLQSWATQSVPLQPCLRDVWHDHILFTGDAVTGIIDYGAAGIDHPAADLARILGDFVGIDPTRVGFALHAYRTAGGSADVPEPFVFALLHAGLIGSVIGWLIRIHEGLPENVPVAAVAARMNRLLDRFDMAGSNPRHGDVNRPSS